MSTVVLFSGGLDSSLLTSMAVEKKMTIYPLFVDYGQKSKKLELKASKQVLENLDTKPLKIVNVAGYGEMCSSGLTSKDKDTFFDAFLPGRNLMFLLLGAAYAYEVGADNLAIGFLSEETSIFPDQTDAFVQKAEELISLSLGKSIKIITPLMSLTKAGVVQLATEKGIRHTYSCHEGTDQACGICVACREFEQLKEA